MFDLDLKLFRIINSWSGQSVALDTVSIFFAHWLIFVMIALVIFFSLRQLLKDSAVRRRSEVARDLVIILRSSLASICAVFDGLILSLFLFRPRPFVILTDVNLLINPPLTAKSFPSDHAIISFALAFSVLMLHRRLGVVLLVCAGAVAVGRVLVGVHYPLDVLAGAILGIAWALAITLIGRHLKDEARVDKLVTPKH